MSTKGLMLVGACVGILSLIADIANFPAAVTVIGFAGGALFGKGYGIYEERERMSE